MKNGTKKHFYSFLITKENYEKNPKKLIISILAKYRQHTDEEIFQKMQEYIEIKRQNPNITDNEIAEKFGIQINTLRGWKLKTGVRGEN